MSGRSLVSGIILHEWSRWNAHRLLARDKGLIAGVLDRYPRLKLRLSHRARGTFNRYGLDLGEHILDLVLRNHFD